MLVLTRAEGQSITIGENITITFIRWVEGYRIELGIDAPTSIPILREEAKLRERKPAQERQRGQRYIERQ